MMHRLSLFVIPCLLWVAGCDEQKTTRPPTDAAARDERLEKPANEDASSLADGQRLVERLAAARNDSVLRIGPGRYLTSGPLRLHRKRNLTVIFEDTYIYCRDTNANVIEVSESQNINIVGGHFRHDKPKRAYECHGAVAAFAASRDVAIFDAELNGCGAVGLHVNGCQNITAYDCDIHSNTFSAFYLANSSEISLVRNQVHDNASMLQTHNVSGLNMLDNTIHSNRGDWQTDSALGRRYIELMKMQETK